MSQEIEKMPSAKTAVSLDQARGMQNAQTQSETVLSVISRAAADPTCDIEKMERLMAMHERMQDRDAETAFNAAMAEMQTNLPSIAERAKGHGTIRYATLEDINDVVKPIMNQYGFAVSFRVSHEGGNINVTGVLMHKAGHREETTIVLPSDTSGSKNAVQAVGSSVSYGKRYVMSALLNLTTRGEDDDGYAAAPVATVTDAQAEILGRILAECPDNAKSAFAAEYGSPHEVRKSDYETALSRLHRAAKANQKQYIEDDRLDTAIKKIHAGEYSLESLYSKFILRPDQQDWIDNEFPTKEDDAE